MATGMSLALSMIALKTALNSTKPNAKYVIWSRIDQKSCFKSIFVAGLVPIIVENCLITPPEGSNLHIAGGQIETNVAGVEAAINQYGTENIVCVLSTTRLGVTQYKYCECYEC